jgi:hypothetical protein
MNRCSIQSRFRFRFRFVLGRREKVGVLDRRRW